MEILFQLLLKGCTIEAPQCLRASCPRCSFQLLLKGCTIEAYFLLYTLSPPTSFQLLLKGCTIEAWQTLEFLFCLSRVSVVVERMYDWSVIKGQQLVELRNVSVVVERMYDWSVIKISMRPIYPRFSCCWKDVRLKPHTANEQLMHKRVSVVVERMYDWS